VDIDIACRYRYSLYLSKKCNSERVKHIKFYLSMVTGIFWSRAGWSIFANRV